MERRLIPRTLIVAAASGMAGFIIGAGTVEWASSRAYQSPRAQVRINSPEDQGVVQYRDLVQGTTRGNASGWKLVIAVQGFYDEVRDPHIHPQYQPIPTVESWSIPATFGYSGNFGREVDFDIMAYLTRDSEARVFSRYLETGQLNDVPGFPGFLTSQIPLGTIEEYRIHVRRLALTEEQIQEATKPSS